VSGIFTDIDNTFVYDGCKAATVAVLGLACKRRMPVVAVTGADLNSVFSRIMADELPYFRALATSCGTEIYFLSKGGYYQDHHWDNQLRSRFNRKEVFFRAENLAREWAVTSPGCELEIQKKKVTEKYKVSFYFKASDGLVASMAAEEILSYFSEYQLAWCEDITWEPKDGLRRYCVDVLAANKQDAVEYITEQLGITDGIVAGDSGNDAEMVLDCDRRFVGVVVGGAREELKEALRKRDPRPVGKIQDSRGFSRYYLDGRFVLVDEHPDRRGPESILAALEVLYSA
jgi:hydroxymethylpyrimidine pyrophosphatase-like HAD family hydrolase